MKSDITAAIVIIAALVCATWSIYAKASEDVIQHAPLCQNEWGHPREQWWCDKRDAMK